MGDMDPATNHQPSAPYFPLYELHPMASTHHHTSIAAIPTAMDILCEIVTSEYSDGGYNVSASAQTGLQTAANASEHQAGADRDGFLYILNSRGSKPLNKNIENHRGHKMLHEETTPSSDYDMKHANPHSLNPNFSNSPELHRFKLPLLEQEPETSINNSEIDGKLKSKEIRRNLESSILLHQVDSGTTRYSSTPIAHAELQLELVKHEDKHDAIPSEDTQMHKTDEKVSGSTRSLKIMVHGGGKQGVDEDNVMKRARVAELKLVSGGDKNVGTNDHPYEDDIQDGMAGFEDGWKHESKKRMRVETSPGWNTEKKRAITGHNTTTCIDQTARTQMGAASGTPTAAGTGTGPRIAHISVERNRRKQMNEHLAILRSLMPTSYVQRSDQASIIGGVVEFIKELQQLLASLEAQKRRRAYVADALSPRVSSRSPPGSHVSQSSVRGGMQELVATSRSGVADVEVKLTGGAHVMFRALSHKSTRGQLLHLIAALECLSLQILHLNITTLQQAVLYTFTLQIGIECRLSVDDLANIGQQIFKDIHARHQ